MKTIRILSVLAVALGLLTCDLGLFTPKARLNPTDPGFTAGTDPRMLIKQGADSLWTGGSYDFGTIKVGESRQVTFSIQNKGGADLVLSGTPPVSLSGSDAAQFSVTTAAGATIKTGEETTFVLAFTPSSAGAKTATLKVSSNDPISATYTLTLRGTGSQDAVTAVMLNKSSTTMLVGGTEQLTATLVPASAWNQAVTWSSSDGTKATVSATGLVTAVAAGSATITVTTADGGKTAACTVTVSAVVVAVTGVTLDKTTASVSVGGTEQLAATVAPAGATNQNVSWFTSYPAVATVGTGGLVIGVSAGTATIIVTTADGGKTATCTVTVTASGVPVTGVTLNKTAATLSVGGTEQLTATIAPAGATNQNVSWSTSYPAVATVGPSGLVVGVAAGTATIIATTADGGKTATCLVTVVMPVSGVTLNKPSTTLVAGGTEQLTATIAPAGATNQAVTWSSSDTAVATVTGTGLLTAVAAGSATITVSTADGGKMAACAVTVSASSVSVSGVTLNKSVTTIGVGGTEQLTATIAPAGATNQNVAWSSGDPAVVTAGPGGLVTGVAAGTATVTVTTADGGKTAICAVTVLAALPTIVTAAFSNITATAATGGGTVISTGGAPVTVRGVCWSVAANPTTTDSRTTDGAGTGSFTSSLTGLAAGTTYYARAYATNSTGTAYGNEVGFTTGYVVTYDGNANTGGSVPVDTVAYTQGQTVYVLGDPGNLVKSGYTLAGWNTQADGSGSAYVQGQGFTMGTANVTLYARWTIDPTLSDFGAISKNWGAAAFDLTAPTSNSGGLFSYTSSNPTVATISGSTVTVLAVGTSTITAIQAAAGNYSAGVISAMLTVNAVVPTVVTTAVSGITATAASGGGSVSTDGGALVTSRGVCWGTGVNPTTADSMTVNGMGTGSFTSSLTGLQGGTAYYVRAYAINSAGTAYGNEIGFTLYTVTYDGNGSTGGNVPTDSNGYTQGQSVTVSGNTGSLVKTGYYFGWWNTAANGSGTSYGSGASFTMGTANMTLYAKWTFIEMVGVAGGTFEMGLVGEFEPVHSVTVGSFRMSKYEVTQGQYQTVTGSSPSYFTADTNRPVERVTWYDAMEFCNKLSVLEGLDAVYAVTGRTPASGYPITSATVTADWSKNGYRLPTEAEWEYAARGGAGSLVYTYAGGNTVDTVAWYLSNSGNTTHVVGGKSGNELGLYDMSGNVWEWCWDLYGSYSSGAQTDPVGATSGPYRVLRGGAWYHGAAFCRSAVRLTGIPSDNNNGIGFRVVIKP